MKTTNGGLNWYINPWAGYYNTVGGYSQIIYSAYFFNQSTGILAGYGNLRKTTDGGITFNDIAGTLSGWSNIFFLNNNTGYVTAGNVGSTPRLSKTTDGGNTWVSNTTIPSYNSSYWDIYTSDDINILVLAANGYIARSTDGGSTWNMAPTGSAVPFWKMKFINHDTGFICGYNGSVRWTTDGGISWTGISNLVTRTFYDIDFRISENNIAVYITGDLKYIYKSTDLGVSWDTVGILAPNQINIDSVYMNYLASDFISNDSLISVGKYGYINKRFSTNDRVCYTQNIRNGLLNYAVINGIWVQGNGDSNLWAVGSSGIGGNQYIPYDQIMYSSNSGLNWTIQPTVTTAVLNSIHMINANTGYIAGGNGTILKTTNTGNNWISLPSPTSFELKKISFVNISTGWVFGNGGAIYKTTDEGSNWTQQTVTGPSINGASMLDPNTGWFAGNNGIVYKTVNGGINWIAQSSNTSNNINCIKMLSSSTGYLCGENGTVKKTTDGGNNWNSLVTPFSSAFYYSLDFSDTLNGILTSDIGVVHKTTDGGQSWMIFSTNAEGAIYTSYMVSPGIIFVGGYSAGILKYSSGIIGITEWRNTLPKEYKLYQNYPNPFNPSTIIKFDIPKAGYVTLKVYDITGREVSTIIHNLQLNRGTVNQTFDGSNISSGVYLYSLFINGNLVDTKKMVMVK
jgi:photosystem II stability/assembly factor-like uncharacterized protein